MALTQKIIEALNIQFNEELVSAYLYDSMAADFRSKNLPGFAAWMTLQATEERTHAEKIHHYLDDHGARVHYKAIPEPQAEWESPLAIIRAALKHEQYISSCFHKLVTLARAENDITTETFLAWYVTEQVEEEATAQALIDKLEMIGDNTFGLYQLDKEVSTRE